MTEPGPALDAEWRGLHPRLLVLRRIECLLLLGLPALVAAGVLLALRGPAAAGAALLVGGLLLGLALSGVQRRFAAWAYAEREDDLLVRRGVLIRRTSVVPYGRMQYGDVQAGPLDRMFGIARVQLHTASAQTDAQIPGLPPAEAGRLRDRLASRGQAQLAGL